MSEARVRVESVPVAGGRLALEIVESSTEPVLAIHGVSSHRRLWDWLRAEAPEISLVAPDLRGRGDSAHVGAPRGLGQHGDDMIAVLDALGLDTVHVCGMSMGGFVAVDLALRHPDRVRSLVLVDGGLPMGAPAGLTRERIPGLFADRLGRLEQRWTSLDDLVAFFVHETAPLLDPGDATLRHYLEHDLDADGRVRLDGETLLADAADAILTPPRWQDVRVPMRLLYAEWSKGTGTPPAYSREQVVEFRSTTSLLVGTTFLPGADHAATIMTKQGAAATAQALLEALT